MNGTDPSRTWNVHKMNDNLIKQVEFLNEKVKLLETKTTNLEKELNLIKSSTGSVHHKAKNFTSNNTTIVTNKEVPKIKANNDTATVVDQLGGNGKDNALVRPSSLVVPSGVQLASDVGSQASGNTPVKEVAKKFEDLLKSNNVATSETKPIQNRSRKLSGLSTSTPKITLVSSNEQALVNNTSKTITSQSQRNPTSQRTDNKRSFEARQMFQDEGSIPSPPNIVKSKPPALRQQQTTESRNVAKMTAPLVQPELTTTERTTMETGATPAVQGGMSNGNATSHDNLIDQVKQFADNGFPFKRKVARDPQSNTWRYSPTKSDER